MKKKIAIIIIIFGAVIFITGSIYEIMNGFKNKSQNKEKKETVTNKYKINNYKEALELAKSYYEDEENLVELQEENEIYIILVKSRKKNEIVYRFQLDKKTGIVSRIFDLETYKKEILKEEE